MFAVTHLGLPWKSVAHNIHLHTRKYCAVAALITLVMICILYSISFS